MYHSRNRINQNAGQSGQTARQDRNASVHRYPPIQQQLIQMQAAAGNQYVAKWLQASPAIQMMKRQNYNSFAPLADLEEEEEEESFDYSDSEHSSEESEYSDSDEEYSDDDVLTGDFSDFEDPLNPKFDDDKSKNSSKEKKESAEPNISGLDEAVFVSEDFLENHFADSEEEALEIHERRRGKPLCTVIDSFYKDALIHEIMERNRSKYFQGKEGNKFESELVVNLWQFRAGETKPTKHSSRIIYGVISVKTVNEDGDPITIRVLHHYEKYGIASQSSNAAANMKEPPSPIVLMMGLEVLWHEMITCSSLPMFSGSFRASVPYCIVRRYTPAWRLRTRCWTLRRPGSGTSSSLSSCLPCCSG